MTAVAIGLVPRPAVAMLLGGRADRDIFPGPAMPVFIIKPIIFVSRSLGYCKPTVFMVSIISNVETGMLETITDIIRRPI